MELLQLFWHLKRFSDLWHAKFFVLLFLICWPNIQITEDYFYSNPTPLTERKQIHIYGSTISIVFETQIICHNNRYQSRFCLCFLHYLFSSFILNHDFFFTLQGSSVPWLWMRLGAVHKLCQQLKRGGVRKMLTLLTLLTKGEEGVN